MWVLYGYGCIRLFGYGVLDIRNYFIVFFCCEILFIGKKLILVGGFVYKETMVGYEFLVFRRG